MQTGRRVLLDNKAVPLVRACLPRGSLVWQNPAWQNKFQACHSARSLQPPTGGWAAFRMRFARPLAAALRAMGVRLSLF